MCRNIRLRLQVQLQMKTMKNSISCDEARSHKEEQMSICIRYTNNLEVKERFLGFVDMSNSQTADALYSSIISFLQFCDPSDIPIVGQSFDGANVMSGNKGGVQTKLKQIYPYAIYIHCMAHKLNLVIVDTYKHLKDLRKLFNALEAIYVDFSYPSKNKKFNEIQNQLGLKKKSLVQLSETRWSCRFKSCNSIIQNYGVFSAVVLKIAEAVSRKRLRKEPSQLKGFVCLSTTSASDDHIVETKKEYWKKKAYYCILDKSEMSVLRNILGENPSLEQIQQHSALYDSKVFPNFSKMFQVAITLPISTATCERSFSAMRRIKTWLRTCMNQDRFSNLSILNIENDISINNEDILNIFEKTERRIQLR